LEYVVDVDTVCLFKARLDKFWMYQDVLYDFTADLTESATDQYANQVDCST